MRPVLFFLLITAISNRDVRAQGCVALKSTGAMCTKHSEERDFSKGWQLNVGYRYFKSFRHFVGTEEQKHRVEGGTDVRNWQSTADFTLTRNLDSRWSLGFYLPVQANRRSSLYEHGGKERHTTSSFGVGDIRFSAYRWLLNPEKFVHGNIQAGLGIKLPTGDYRYQDFFYTADNARVLGPVDQSIQLGDGGTGFSTELNGYYNFSRSVGVYGNFYYLFNPREHNGVSTARGGVPSANSIAYKSSTMSVPDQYMARAGANVNVRDLTVSAGMRMECIPAKDLIGGSAGFRRPGYVIAAEPGVSYQWKKVTAFATVPVAIERNRTQSEPDKIRTKVTGVYAQGDAAFADYSVNAGLAIKF